MKYVFLLLVCFFVFSESFGQDETLNEILQELKEKAKPNAQIDRNCADIYHLLDVGGRGISQYNFFHPLKGNLHCVLYSQLKSFRAFLVLSEGDLKILATLKQNEFLLVPEMGLLIEDQRGEGRWLYITKYYEPNIPCSPSGVLEMNELDYTSHLQSIFLVDNRFNPLSELRIEVNKDTFEKLSSVFRSCDRWFEMKRKVNKSMSYKEIKYDYLVEILEENIITEMETPPSPM